MVIATGSEVKDIARLTNEFTDEEINTEIDIVQGELYSKHFLPKRSTFTLDEDYTRFYISNDPAYDIIRVSASVTTDIDPSGYTLIESTGSWTFTPGTNYIDVTSSFLNEFDNKLVRVEYIPKIYNLLAANLAALNLIEETTITDGSEVSTPQAAKIKDRIDRYKTAIKPRISLRSSLYTDYDPYDYVTIDQTNFR